MSRCPRTRTFKLTRIMLLPRSYVKVPRVFFARSVGLAGIPNAHGIYRVVCVPMNTAYIGQAYSLLTRCMEHQIQLRDRLHTNTRLQGAYQKFGPSAFYFEVMELYRGRWSPDCLSPAEQRWMDLHPLKFNVRPAGSDAWLKVVAAANSPDNRHQLKENDDDRAKVGDNRAKVGDNRPLGRGAIRKVGVQTEKDWRNQMPGPTAKRKGT